MQLVPRPRRDGESSKKFESDHPHQPWIGFAEQSKMGDDRRSRDLHTGILRDRYADDSLDYRESDRVVILVDGSNLFYAASQLNLEIDYARLLAYLTKNRRLVRAYFYTGVDRFNEKQQGFLHWMRRNGYRVVTKDLIQLPDGSKKANLDIEIAIDMLTLAAHCDTMILLSGDGDLTYAVNQISYQGVQIEVVSLRSMTNDTLINVADSYIDLETIRHDIQRM
ncbi:LabA-like NYN domain-containing protein [Phormidesmis priestleyi]